MSDPGITYIDPETGEPVSLPAPTGFGGNPPPMPALAPQVQNILNEGVQKWDTIAGSARKVFDSFTGALEDTGSAIIGDVKSLVRTGMDVSQTFWSTYIGTLEAWTVAGIDEVGSAIDDVRVEARTGAIELGQMIEALGGELVDGLTNVIKIATTYADDVRDALTNVIAWDVASVMQWAIDNLYHPLLGEITTVDNAIRADVLRGFADVEAYVRDLVMSEMLDRIAAIAGLAAAVGAITTWVEECGAPMCETYGPGTNLTKVLKGLEGLLGLLTGVSLANLTESDLVKLAGYFEAITQGDVEGFVNAFVGAGETLGSAGGTILSDIGHIAGDAFAEVSGL